MRLCCLRIFDFMKKKESNDEHFAKKLASLGEIYINDAFSCSHRNHASVSKITKYIPSYRGIQINTEVNALKKITQEIKEPITCIIGGSKFHKNKYNKKFNS